MNTWAHQMTRKEIYDAMMYIIITFQYSRKGAICCDILNSVGVRSIDIFSVQIVCRSLSRSNPLVSLKKAFLLIVIEEQNDGDNYRCLTSKTYHFSRNR